MYVVIKIAGDSTSWWTRSLADGNALAGELAQGAADVPVFYPVIGSLLISAEASVAILDVPPGDSWIPSDVKAPVATLYVQSGPSANPTENPALTLPVGTNLDDLASEIISAMDDGGTVSVNVSSGDFSGVALLNGATLTFAVVCPPDV